MEYCDDGSLEDLLKEYYDNEEFIEKDVSEKEINFRKSILLLSNFLKL